MVRGFESLFEPCQFEASFLVPYPFLVSSFAAGECSNVEYRGHSRAYLTGGMDHTLLRFQGVGARVGCKFSINSGYFLIVGYARSFRRTLVIRLQPQLAKDLVRV